MPVISYLGLRSLLSTPPPPGTQVCLAATSMTAIFYLGFLGPCPWKPPPLGSILMNLGWCGGKGVWGEGAKEASNRRPNWRIGYAQESLCHSLPGYRVQGQIPGPSRWALNTSLLSQSIGIAPSHPCGEHPCTPCLQTQGTGESVLGQEQAGTRAQDPHSQEAWPTSSGPPVCPIRR